MDYQNIYNGEKFRECRSDLALYAVYKSSIALVNSCYIWKKLMPKKILVDLTNLKKKILIAIWFLEPACKNLSLWESFVSDRNSTYTIVLLLEYKEHRKLSFKIIIFSSFRCISAYTRSSLLFIAAQYHILWL